nr:hypothetical protein [Streptomyces sp. SID4951]
MQVWYRFIVRDPPGGTTVGKKQSRQNRGARTGGHERSAAAEAKEKAKASTPQEPEQSMTKHVAHKAQRKFGHN